MNLTSSFSVYITGMLYVHSVRYQIGLSLLGTDVSYLQGRHGMIIEVCITVIMGPITLGRRLTTYATYDRPHLRPQKK
jgi:hypothetical protein